MTNGMEIARRLIAEEREKQTGFLDLGRLGLTELPEELFELTELRGLNLSYIYEDGHGRWKETVNRLNHNSLTEIPAGLSTLRQLKVLILMSNSISDLRGLTTPRTLDFSTSTALADDLTSLPPLPSLQYLDLSDTLIFDLNPLRVLRNLRTLGLSLSRTTDLKPLEALINLQKLDFSGTAIQDLRPIQDLVGLEILDLDVTRVDDLTYLQGLNKLKALSCGGTRVQDLSPLRKLSALVDLNFRDTAVADLSPLLGLTSLEALNCAETPITDWRPLQHLSTLKSLNVQDTGFFDLSLLQPLEALQELICSNTEISDLRPIQALSTLRSLLFDSTQITDLRPLSSLTKLERLSIWDTSVSDLSPIRDLPALKYFNCSNTSVRELTPLLDLPCLETLGANTCTLDDIPRKLVFSEILCCLTLHETNIPGIPTEVLSDKPNSNCLPTLRAHLLDLEAGSAEIRQTKLVVLGNGRVGKTQLCRHLRGLPFDETIPSTHGITVTSEPWVGAEGDETLNIWDFGGQDIYHGAHTLFMKTSAVFVIVWHPEFEDGGEETANGLMFRNYPLSYWLEYVRTLGRKDSPVIVVQSRCERPEQEVRRLPVDEALLDLPFIRQCSFSAKTGRGKGTLHDALQDAVATLRQRDGVTTIGKGRMTVLRQLERWRDEDQSRPVAEREHRTLSQTEFHNLCEQAGGVSSSESLLAYLHNLGVVFHRPALFEDRIILDQSWALDAVYGVFERGQAYPLILSQAGRFNRSLLAMTVWRDYTDEDQRLFLSLMESCGIIFKHREADPRYGLETEYLAPDLLMDKAAVAHQLAGRWNESERSWRLEYEYPFLHPGLMRALICDVGQRSADAGVYWKYGLWVYESTGCRAQLEQRMSDLHRGRIVMKIQGPGHEQLARWLRERIEARNRFFGYPALQPVVDEFKVVEQLGRPGVARSTTHAEEMELTGGDEPGAERSLPEPNFAQPPATFFTAGEPQVFVSYAWGDRTPEGLVRGQLVDVLCSKLGEQGVKVHRDRDELRPGDRISAFMDRLAEGDFILAVISDKYLKSENCMYELFNIYRNCASKPERFLGKVIPLVLPDAALNSLATRFTRAIHWKNERAALEPLIRDNLEAAGNEIIRKFRLLDEFARNTSDMLELLADKLQPRDFDRQAAEGFTEILDQIQRKA